MLTDAAQIVVKLNSKGLNEEGEEAVGLNKI